MKLSTVFYLVFALIHSSSMADKLRCSGGDVGRSGELLIEFKDSSDHEIVKVDLTYPASERTVHYQYKPQNCTKAGGASPLVFLRAEVECESAHLRFTLQESPSLFGVPPHVASQARYLFGRQWRSDSDTFYSPKDCKYE